MQLVMSEILLFSLCDYFIVSYNSGLAKFGVWLSENRNDNNDNVFLEHRDDPNVNPVCKPYSVIDMAKGNNGL